MDEVRRLQRIAYRTAQIAAHGSAIHTEDHCRFWEEAEEFQPLRELIERALVAYDWGEAFVATNVVIKPLIDRLINEEIAGTVAIANGDPILANVHFSLDEDARWHREWTAALASVLISDRPASADVVSEWIDRWRPRAVAAVDALAEVAVHAPVAGDPTSVAARVVDAAAREWPPAAST